MLDGPAAVSGKNGGILLTLFDPKPINARLKLCNVTRNSRSWLWWASRRVLRHIQLSLRPKCEQQPPTPQRPVRRAFDIVQLSSFPATARHFSIFHQKTPLTRCELVDSFNRPLAWDQLPLNGLCNIIREKRKNNFHRSAFP